jgi:hypothetical protein
MTCSTLGAANTAFSLPEMRTRSSGIISATYLTWDAFVGHDYYLVMYLNLWSYVLNYIASTKQNLVCNILFWTLMDVICMPLAKCCNEWRVVLNHYNLGLYVKSCLKSFEISRLPGLWELKYMNLITSVIVLYLRSYNLVNYVTIYLENSLRTTIIHSK